MASKALKYCHTCGRSFTWRASMSTDWATVKYCSHSCRTHKPHANRTDLAIERSFLSLLLAASSSSRKVLCSQVQEADGPERTEVSWRERYRRAARRLANVQELCKIEHCEKGDEKWKEGDGKGEMRVWLQEGKAGQAKSRHEELAERAPGGQAKDQEGTRPSPSSSDDEAGKKAT